MPSWFLCWHHRLTSPLSGMQERERRHRKNFHEEIVEKKKRAIAGVGRWDIMRTGRAFRSPVQPSATANSLSQILWALSDLCNRKYGAQASIPITFSLLSILRDLPAFSKSLHIIQAVTDVISLGLATTVFPHAIAGAIFQVNKYSGKFQGLIKPATKQTHKRQEFSLLGDNLKQLYTNSDLWREFGYGFYFQTIVQQICS